MEEKLSWHMRNRDAANAQARAREKAKRYGPEREQVLATARVEAKAYRERHRERIKERHKQYRSDPEKQAIARARTEAWRLANPHRVYQNNAARKARQISSTPAWANKEAMDFFYLQAQTLREVLGENYHVDHIVPLKGKTVCGLHCETNLQILPAAENIRKNCHVWPDMW